VSTRVLVAYERPDGAYDCHEGRGEGLAARLTARTPFGGRGTPVDPSPVARGVGGDDLGSRVDLGRHEALMVVTPDYDATAFVALPFGVPDASRGVGALVESHGLLDEAHLLGWVRGFRAALHEAVDAGLEPGWASDRLRSEARGFEHEGREVRRV
jgi:hypothetical protein